MSLPATRHRPGWARLLTAAVFAAVVPVVTITPAAHAAPSIEITSTPAGAAVGTPYTFGGTVSDDAGIAGVEVSSDNGAHWQVATWTVGQTTWSATYTPKASGTAQLSARTVDSTHTQTSIATAGPTVAPRACPCSLWSDADVPANPDVADSSALELGVKWRSGTAGHVRGVRFYKGSGNTGTHTGSLWNTAGQRLATGTFADETATGWQTLIFSSPVAVAADTTYVASYLSPTGHFALNSGYFASSARYLEPLTGLQSGTEGFNGVFRGGAGYPDLSANDANYWVDVVWATEAGPDTHAPDQLSTAPLAGAGSVGLSPSITAGYDEVLDPTAVEFTLTGPGGAVAAQTSVISGGTTAKLTPDAALTAGTTYTASVRVKDVAGNQTTAYTWTFRTGATRPADCPCTIWDDFATPTQSSANDSGAVELGTRVRFTGRGEVLGVRFYKGVGNTGTHTGTLWSLSGTQLATGTFTGESTVGWQTLTFATPVVVQANTDYVVSYYAPNGHYAADQGFFSSTTPVGHGQIQAAIDTVAAPNGVYRYGGGFPSTGHLASNYWVDVVYRNGTNGDHVRPTLDTRTPAPDAGDVALGASVTAGFSEAIDTTSAQIRVTDDGGASLAGSAVWSGDLKSVTWTANGSFTPGTHYNVSVTVADVNGNVITAPVTWSFTTQAAGPGVASLFSTAIVPEVRSGSIRNARELGVRFGSPYNGVVSAIKFYKGAGNTGTHTGSIWNDFGTKLATGTFTDETATGWQTLTLDPPLVVKANTIYVASYTTPNGVYSYDPGYFDRRSPVVSGPLYTASGAYANGRYSTTTGAFPTDFYSGNFWVDVDFTPYADQTAPVNTGSTPSNEATGVGIDTSVTATFNEAVSLTGTKFRVETRWGVPLRGNLALANDDKTLVWTPVAPLSRNNNYRVTVEAWDPSANTAAALNWSFTTGDAACPCSVFSAAETPQISETADGNPYELGLRFTPGVDGQVTGVRFYKGIGNTGTHTGSLWTTTGTQLATGTFTGESASGWQTLTFATPVTVTAGTAYVVSYFAPNGHYSHDPSLTSRWLFPVNTPQLGGVASVYGNGTGFPTIATNGNYGPNYWVDVVFTN
ncbi:DUF4082 domain-containing protein [Actinosynnema sp. NPDC047251]|uniref:DUF4082 domain-containing protein n=1 Tax=Saccharothrix espanaensis (strain ATCC 51144 / DSM 44229 / JCM 9112 / NBRC 15066 / NRRL 15764) TaxID=1179773 RepID=K0JYD1_SACES|nr:DUF4082 domain-containing protein [Saccharothrix espanaensis]CCH31131.1 hypothetical protein BN6_38410 [Saccharothrix espanaensis DSM 44229]